MESFRTKNGLKLVVIKGGTSFERDVSLKSGSAVAQALRDGGHEVFEIDLREESFPSNMPHEFDLVFPVLHGSFGEDGKFQKLLEGANVPFIGCDSKTSEVLMNKDETAKIAMENGILMPQGIMIDKNEWEGNDEMIVAKILSSFSFPLIVKPSNQGSSFGLSMVGKIEDLVVAIDAAFKYDHQVILQEFIKGVEIAIGVVNGKALPIVEIIPYGELYDFDAKYVYAGGQTVYNCPPEMIKKMVCDKAQKIAEKCFQVFNCRDLSRMDFIVRNDDVFFIEGNTIPGFTASSLVPKSAAAQGITFPELCDFLVQSAFLRYNE